MFKNKKNLARLLEHKKMMTQCRDEQERKSKKREVPQISSVNPTIISPNRSRIKVEGKGLGEVLVRVQSADLGRLNCRIESQTNSEIVLVTPEIAVSQQQLPLACQLVLYSVGGGFQRAVDVFIVGEIP